MTAKIISIAQAKGGVGKSTICANLAVTLSKSAKVLMVDCDSPQNSLSAWFQVRSDLYEDTGLRLEQVSSPSHLTKVLETHKNDYDYILIDGAPHVNSLVRAMLLASHLVVVPLAPSSVEIWSFASFEKLIEDASKLNSSLQTKICWNRVRRRVKSSDEIIRNVAKDSKLTALKSVLTFRVAYMDSFAQGCSVFEWSDPVASAEIWSISSAIKRMLNKVNNIKTTKSAVAQDFIKKG